MKQRRIYIGLVTILPNGRLLTQPVPLAIPAQLQPSRQQEAIQDPAKHLGIDPVIHPRTQPDANRCQWRQHCRRGEVVRKCPTTASFV
jgi:hypothetical protein